MVHEDLFARLNEAGYKNWLKAGYCLLKVKDGLWRFVDEEMRRFHHTVTQNNFALRTGQRCRNGCRPRGNQFEPACSLCHEWKTEILHHHTNPSGVINWGNCKSWQWQEKHWEVAKAFMPRGLFDQSSAEQCDAAALLNLLRFCDRFSFINQNLITEVIRCRNELMHSCEMQVSNEWMKRFQKSLEQFLRTLRNIPEVAATGQHIQEMLSIDLLLHISGVDVDSMDGAEVDGVLIESISQCETELLSEALRDLLNNSEPEGSLIPQEKLKSVQRFFGSYKDLQEKFGRELQDLQDRFGGEGAAWRESGQC